MTETYAPFAIVNHDSNEPQHLRAQLQQNGFLFLRGIVPRNAVLKARKEVLEVCREAGWTDNNAELMDARWSGVGPFTENEPEYMAVYRRVLRLPAFLALPENPALLQLIQGLLGAPVLVHRRKIGRVTFPQNIGQTTGIHQDWHYIRGTPQTYTLWIPLGDCPRELGGLAVLNASHRGGYIEHRETESKKYAAAGLAESDLPQGENIEWQTGDLQVGDALLFHAHTIHKALPNLTPNTLRLSTDNRYQREGDAIEPGSLGTHYGL